MLLDCKILKKEKFDKEDAFLLSSSWLIFEVHKKKERISKNVWQSRLDQSLYLLRL